MIMYGNMRWLTISFALLLGGRGGGGIDDSPHAQRAFQVNERHNEYAVLKYFLPLLRANHKAGRIYYDVTCHENEARFYSFPKINVHQPSEEASVLAEAKEIFRGNSGVEVTENPFGIIRIRIGRVPGAILQTRISSIRLRPIEQYNPALAIFAIENNKDVRVAMHKLGISMASRVSNQGVALPATGLPHLPDSLVNVTMDQALDVVARTFEGIVVYGSCLNSSQYTIDFTGGVGFDESKLR